MNIEQMSDGLVRQRRNLLVLSSLMIFIKFAGIEIEKFSVFGFQFEKLSNPAATYAAIWALFAYFSVRYYQYFMQEGVMKIQAAYYNGLEIRVHDLIRNITNENYKDATAHSPNLATIVSNTWNVRINFPVSRDSAGGVIQNTKNLVLTNKLLFKSRAMTVFNISINSSVLTDYILPVTYAIFTLYYCISDGKSSLMSVIGGT